MMTMDMPAKILEQVEDIDCFIQGIRCSFIKLTLKPEEKIAKEIKSKIDQKLETIKSTHSGKSEPKSSLKIDQQEQQSNEQKEDSGQ